MILVDTSVLIDFFKGNSNTAVQLFRKVIQQEIPFGISSIIYQEILQGAKTEHEYKILKDYLGSQHFFNPENERNSYSDAASIYFKCRKNGITIRSTIDCLIAQVAIECDLYLLHNDKDFSRMSDIVDLKIFEGIQGAF